MILEKSLLLIFFILFSVTSYSLFEENDINNTMNLIKENSVVINQKTNKEEIIDEDAKETNYTHIADSCFNQGIEFDNQKNYIKAIDCYKKAREIYETLENNKSISQCYYNIGINYIKMDNLYYGTTHMYKSLRIREKINDTFGIADCKLAIGNIFNEMDNDSSAMKFYFISLKIYQELEEYNRTGICYQNIGNIYLDMADYQNATKYYNMSAKIFKEIGDNAGIMGVFNNIGNTFLLQNNYSKALEYYKKAIEISAESEQGVIQAKIYINIAILQNRHKEYNEAIRYALKGLQIAETVNAMQSKSTAYQVLKETYYYLGDYNKALKYADLFINIKDSLLNIENSKQIIEIKTKYETEKKEKEIEIQALKISEAELKLNRNKIGFFTLIGGIVLIIIFGWIIFIQYKAKQKAKLIREMLKQQELRTKAIVETQENERKRIAQDLHDDMGHKLTTLKIYFEKLSDIFDTFPEKKNIFKQITNLLDETHKEIRSLSHKMMPKALQDNEFSGAISDLLELTLSNTDIKYQLRNNITDNLPENIRICLYRIIQELLNNTLKHAKATEIIVQILKNKNNIIMLFEDNGIGIQNENNLTSGIGLKNIKTRINTVKGNFSIEKAPVKGTVAIARIPLIT